MAALAVVVVLATWRGWADPLVEAWSAWIDGEPMSDVSLWGRRMRFWERFGKVCIFLAGMSVLLDLADPEDLRERGRGASDRIREARARAAAARMEKQQALRRFSKRDEREAERLERLYREVRDTLVESKVSAPRHGPHSMISPYTAGTFVVLLSPSERARNIADLVNGDSRFDEASLRHLHESLLAGRHDVCTQPSRCLSDGQDLCDRCQNHVDDLVERYVDGLLNDSERDLLHRQQELIDRAAKGTTALDVWLVIMAAGLAVAVLGSAADHRWLGLASVASLLLLAVSIVMGRFGPRQHLSLLLEARAAATVPVRAFHFSVAMVLDEARPGHVFRWIAFCLFVVGSHFDLLAT